MGSEVQLESYMPGYCSTSELGKEESSRAWNFCDRQFHGAAEDLDSESDNDGLKQKMLEHDAVFRRQVSELHRLYRTQRDLMDEMKRSELYNNHRPLSVNPLVYQRQVSSKLHSPSFHSSNSACRPLSISGTEHSSLNLSFLKRKPPQTDLLSAIDVDDSNDCEIVECRPGKVKRKMLDLHLSADAYIDPDEFDQSIDLKVRIPSRCGKGHSFLSERSGSSSKWNGTKDLNEPIHIEDDPLTLNFMSRKTSGNSLYTKPFPLQTVPKNYSQESSLISSYGGDYKDSKKQLLVDRKNNSEQASHQLSLGQFNTKASSLSQYLRPQSSQQRSQFIHGKNEVGHEPQIPGLKSHLDLKGWPPPWTPLDKYGCNLSHKQPYFISSAGLSKSCQAYNPHSNVFGEKLNINSNHVGIPRISELDHGSSSGSKEESICYSSVKFENLVNGKDGAGIRNHKGLNGFDLNCCEEMDLSASVTNEGHYETAKREESKLATLLPWMKPKPLGDNRSQASQHPPQMFTESASRDHELDLTKSANHNRKQIPWLPVFGPPLTAGSFRLSNAHKSEMKRKLQVVDMNMPCETETEEIADKKVTGLKNFFDLNSCLTDDEASVYSASSALRSFRGIDLEAPAPHEIDEDNTLAGMTQQAKQEAELERVAASAMVLLSSFKNSNIMKRAADDPTDTLEWLVSVVLSCPLDKIEEPSTRASSEETDYFEQMTLNLTEMSTEEPMPKNAFPSIPNIDEEPANVILTGRPRRGQARQSRPKRDFQRDILPGIASLSRHEVTEDVQAIDGLMRSSGHDWQFGKRAAARINPRRGRPRTVNATQVPDPIPIYTSPTQPASICVGAGWGKTTRRPRRQRCPAGNLQTVRLS